MLMFFGSRLRRIGSRPPATEATSTGSSRRTCRREKASSCRVSSDARPADAAMISTRRRRTSSSAISVRRMSVQPTTAVIMLLKSCAMPPASLPTASIFCACRSSASSILRAVMSSTREVAELPSCARVSHFDPDDCSVLVDEPFLEGVRRALARHHLVARLEREILVVGMSSRRSASESSSPCSRSSPAALRSSRSSSRPRRSRSRAGGVEHHPEPLPGGFRATPEAVGMPEQLPDAGEDERGHCGTDDRQLLDDRPTARLNAIAAGTESGAQARRTSSRRGAGPRRSGRGRASCASTGAGPQLNSM